MPRKVGDGGLPGGRLKVVSPLKSVGDAMTGKAAAHVAPLAPMKPEAIASDDALSEAWDQIVPGLDSAGLLSRADLGAVELAVRHFVLARQASDDVMQNGVSIMIDEDNPGKGYKKNPAEAVFRLESTHFLEYAKQLGMTFVARARTPMSSEEDEAGGNPFAAQTGS
jgi:P27 family predicted phage terminase small subunit